MTKASDNPFPSVLFDEGSAPATPSAGTKRVFSTADGVYVIDSTGKVLTVGGTSFARVERSATQSIPLNTGTTIVFDTEVADSGGLVDLATDDDAITADQDGWATIDAWVGFATNASGDRRQIQIAIDGVAAKLDSRPPISGSTTHMAIAVQKLITIGQKVSVIVFQDGADPLNTTANQVALSVKIDPLPA